MWTAGLATAGLGLSVHFFELGTWRRLAYPLQVYGRNALLVFVGSAVVGRVIGSLITFGVDGGEVSLKSGAFEALLAWIGDPKLASLAFALLWVGGWFLVLRDLYRRGVIWRV